MAAEIMTMPLPTSYRRSNVNIQKSERSEHAQSQAAPHMSSDLSAQIASLRGGGTPLSREARSFMEPRFGYDFSQVRVHTGPRAAEAAQSLNARAFTAGHDIAFGNGEYSPGTDAGKRLLAHELTHVVQQCQSHILADAQASQVVQHERTRAVISTASSVRQGERAIDDILAMRELIVQRQQPTNALKDCKEWRFKELKDKPIAFVDGQQYFPEGFDGTQKPIPGKIDKIPVRKFVWTVHQYRAAVCPAFDPDAKKEGALIGYYYQSSLTGKNLSWGGSQPWEFAYANEYNRLRNRKP